MKTIITSVILPVFLLIFLAGTPGFTQQTATTAKAGATYSLTVVVPDVSTRSGKLYIGLADSQTSFDEKSIQNKSVDVPATGPVTVTFDGLPAGRYAVRLYQDLNANGKMDFSGQMPAEPFGLSNVTMLMGPPSFDQCSFDLTADKSIDIKLISM